MIHVYFDGLCGLCAREIAYFRKRQKAQKIIWHDIAREPEVLSGTGLSQADALLFMRVRDEAGTLHSGVNAFITLWGVFPVWSRLARVLRWPGVHQVAEGIYWLFAQIRFRAYPHCRVSLKHTEVSK